MATKRTKTDTASPKAAKPAAKRKNITQASPPPAQVKPTRAVQPASKRTPKTTARRSKTSTLPTPEAIALRAYFLAEKRQAAGLPGDSMSDWLEAERQLLAETAS